jgi:hypothetical protein
MCAPYWADTQVRPYSGFGWGCGGRASRHRRSRLCSGPWPSPRILLLLLLTLLAAACGKKMVPLSPDQTLPGPVRDFRLSQEGDSLTLSWLLPRENLMGQPLTQVQGCQVFRADIGGVQPVTGCLPEYKLWADIDLAYPRAGEVRGEAMLYRDRDLAPDHYYYYKVAAYAQDGHRGAWSPELSHSWGVLPRPPGDLKTEAGDRLVQLTWSPVTRMADGTAIRNLAGYVVYRRTGTAEWLKVTPAPVTAAVYQDVAVLNDVAYTYKLRTVRQVGPDLLESLDSVVLTATPEKLTPPPPLLNLVAAATPKGMELQWDASPAPDLAGYRVYRRQSGESRFTLLNRELLKKPYYLDAQASRGKTYYYYVTAVDNTRRANESSPSETAEVHY